MGEPKKFAIPNTIVITPYQNACSDCERVKLPISGASTGMINPIETMSISTVAMMNGIAAFRGSFPTGASGLEVSVMPRSFHPVVRGFLGDLDVVDMALAHAGRRDLDELRFLVHIGDVRAAAVVHRGAQAAGHLEDHRDDRALVRHLPFDALRYELGRGGVVRA